jgi:hypothetical protein
LKLQFATGPVLVAEIAVCRMRSPETNFGDGLIDALPQFGDQRGAPGRSSV